MASRKQKSKDAVQAHELTADINQPNLKIEYVKVADLIPYDKNPRINAPAVDGCVESIKLAGFSVPISVDENMCIIMGHTRRLAAMKLGMETVPCIVRRDLTPEQVRALRIIDNKISELSEWNEELLKEEIAALPEFDFGSFGFDMDDFTSDMADADTTEDEFDVDAEPEEIRVHRGEIWQLGDHRLMCGDSTSEADVVALMNGELADLWLTDPPYNVNYGDRGEQYSEMGADYQCDKDSRKIMNDNMGDAEFRKFLVSCFGLATKNMKPGATFYIAHSDSEGFNFRGACRDVGLQIRQCLIWKKDSLVLGRQDYQWIHEPILTGWKDGAGHKWRSDRKQTTVLEFDRPKKSELHPTMKPIALFSYLMCNSTDKGDLVLETFGGSGTTLICAERTGRRCNIIELDEKYATVILNRWEEDTGKVGAKIRNADGTPCAATESAEAEG